MRGPTRRISFYLKPEVVKSEKEACDYLDSLPASERNRAQRAAFLAGLALIKRDPSLAYWLAEWPDTDATNSLLSIQPAQNTDLIHQPAKKGNDTNLMRTNIKAFFPE